MKKTARRPPPPARRGPVAAVPPPTWADATLEELAELSAYLDGLATDRPEGLMGEARRQRKLELIDAYELKIGR